LGPTATGFVINVTVVTNFVRGWHDRYAGAGPYWREHRRVHLMTTENTFLKVEVLYGENLNYEFKKEMFSVFGDEAHNL